MEQTKIKQIIERAKKEMFLDMLKVEYVGFLDEAEVYLVLGYMTEEKAKEILRYYEKYDLGLSDDDSFTGDGEEVFVTRSKKRGDDYFSFPVSNRNNPNAVKGWLFRI